MLAAMNPAKPPPNPELTARNFPSAQEDAAAVPQAERYAGPGSAYRLAFTDTEFLLRVRSGLMGYRIVRVDR
jgi:hypothetical protein